MARFSDQQIRRYSRQILLREVGGQGQSRLGAARPVLFCQGEVGALAAEYLWRAGVIAPTLFLPTAEEAERFTSRLLATGYPGAPAQAISEAAPELQRLAAGAPGYTWLQLSGGDVVAPVPAQDSAATSLLWACCRGGWGVVGQGAEALQRTFSDPLAVASPATETGAGAMVIASALALLAVQRIVGISPELSAQPVWQLDLTSNVLPLWW